jgi:hypothetical protein
MSPVLILIAVVALVVVIVALVLWLAGVDEPPGGA